MAAAMQLIVHTEALIIDLRNNGGGSPDGVQFWCSYFFDDTLVHPELHLRPDARDEAVLGPAVRAGDRYIRQAGCGC